MRYVYPRLGLGASLLLIDEIREAYQAGGIEAVRSRVGASHPSAAPVATGGSVASAQQIESCRAQVMLELGPWLERPPGKEPREFDARMGHALHRHLRILPSDAGHVETWSFLSLVVFPDLVAYRFPDLHEDRLLGHRVRNTLRRVWQRSEVLGTLLVDHPQPLGEDECTGLFERTALVRNRRLATILAEEIMQRPQNARSTWARRVYLRVTYSTGPMLLDALNELELRALVQDAISSVGEHHG